MASNEQKIEPPDELQQLREENARLKALLNRYGITWEVVSDTESDPSTAATLPTATHLTISEKIALFRHLFRGRTDVYPTRWQSAKGSAGYWPRFIPFPLFVLMPLVKITFCTESLRNKCSNSR